MRSYIGGMTTAMTEEDLRDQFYAFGEIAQVRMVPAKLCAFITFTSRCALCYMHLVCCLVHVRGRRGLQQACG